MQSRKNTTKKSIPRNNLPVPAFPFTSPNLYHYPQSGSMDDVPALFIQYRVCPIPALPHINRESGLSTPHRSPVIRRLRLTAHAVDGCIYERSCASMATRATRQWLGQTRATGQSTVHLTPIEFTLPAMQYASRAGENVMNLCDGSGSTMIATSR